MSQITKEQAAKVLVGYRTFEKRPTCKACAYYRQRNDMELIDVKVKECVLLSPLFVFQVREDGECDHFKKREPL